MFYKLKFHSVDFYQEFFDEKEQSNIKKYLENILFTLIEKVEKERYLSEIFYAMLGGDNQDFELLLAYPEMIKPSEDLIQALVDNFNTFADGYLMSRLVESSDFSVETISSVEFMNRISQCKSRLFSVHIELIKTYKEQTYDTERKYKELLMEHPELK